MMVFGGIGRGGITPEVTPYRSKLLYSGYGKLGSFKAVDPFYTFSVIKNTDDKFYFAAHSREDNNRDPYLYCYNPVTNEIEQEFRLEMGVVSEDIHRIPVINHDASGNIYVVVEELLNPTGHGTDLKLYKTSTPYDLTSLTLLNTITGRYAYPTLKISGSNIFISARGTTSEVTFIRGQYWYHTSTDGGDTFASAVKLYDSGDEDRVAYFQRVHSYTGETCLVLNERYNTDLSWPFVAFVKSTDHITWSNADGSWTKNVVSGGEITRAEMISNCLIVASPDPGNVSVNFEGGCVKTSGGVRIAVSVNTLTGNTYLGTSAEVDMDELRFYTQTGGVWGFNNVTIPAGITHYWEYDRPCQYMNNNEAFDDIAFIDFAATRSFYKKRSADNFDTTTSTEIIGGNSLYMMGQSVFNVESEDDYFTILQDPKGDRFEITDETAQDYSYLLLVRP